MHLHLAHLDVTSQDNWVKVVNNVVQAHGALDIFAHCAGIEGSYTKAGLDTSMEDWNRVISVNLTGSFLGCQTVMPHMLKQGSGSIIQVATCVSNMATPVGIAYGESKAGVAQLAKTFSALGWQDGKQVRCNSVHPGAIRSRMTENTFAELSKVSNRSVAETEAGPKSSFRWQIAASQMTLLT